MVGRAHVRRPEDPGTAPGGTTSRQSAPRLGVYVDTTLAEQTTDGSTRVCAGQEGFPFLTVVAEVGSRFSEVVYFGRRPAREEVVHALPGTGSVAALPHYSR